MLGLLILSYEFRAKVLGLDFGSYFGFIVWLG